MDIANQIRYTTWGYIGLKIFHIVAQGSFITFMAEEYDGEGREHFLSVATGVFIIILGSMAWLLFNLAKVGYNYTKMEIITFLILLFLFAISTLFGYLKYKTSQEKNDSYNHVNKSQNLETSTDPAYIINISTLETTYPQNDFNISKSQNQETITDSTYIMDKSTLESTYPSTLESAYPHFTSKAPYMKKKAVDLHTNLKKTFSGVLSNDFESSSIFPNESTIEYVTMRTPFASKPSVTPKKFTCRYMFVCIVLPSLVILTFQTIIIVVASVYRKLINGNIDDLIPPVGYQADDGEGEVNLGFQNNENPQNNLENGPPAHQNNENSQNNLENAPPAHQNNENSQNNLENGPPTHQNNENFQNNLENGPPTHHNENPQNNI